MAVAKTLSEYRQAVVYEAAIGGATGDGSTFRHPTDDLIREMNSAYASFREELTTRDFDFFVVEGEQDALPTDRADVHEQYTIIDWPTNAQVLRRIDVYSAGMWEALSQIDWARIRDVAPQRGDARQSRPRFFAIKNFGSTNSFEGVDGTEYEQVAGEIAIIPFATTGQIKMSFLPFWVPILDDDDLFLFPDEVGFRWCVWEVVARISVRDRNAGKRYDMSQQQRAVCETKIGRYVPKVINTGAVQMRRSRRYNW